MAVRCRDDEVRALNTYLGEDRSWPPTISVHGAPGTGKTTVVREFLESKGYVSSWVQCDQCMTARILLQRALRQIFETTQTGTPEEAVCENVDVFVNLLSTKFLKAQFTGRHVLVLDRIDRLPEYRSSLDLLSSLSRVREIVQPPLENFVVVFITSTTESSVLVATPNLPRLWFPRYSRSDALTILQGIKNDLAPAGYDGVKEEFLELVYKAFSPTTGTNVAQLQRTARKIWPQFIAGADLEQDSVAKLYVRRQALFSSDQVTEQLGSQWANMPTVQSYLLCAAYLASYNSPRYDMRYFSLAKTMRNRRRETRPKKALTIPARSLAPPAFEMERLLAIFHAIHPDAFEFFPTIEVGRALATLTAQNMVVKTAGDPLDSRTKWKINVSWSFVQRVSSDIGFSIEDYLVE